MSLLHAIFFGIFILILAGLGFSHPDAVTGIIGGSSSALIGETKALQLR